MRYQAISLMIFLAGCTSTPALPEDDISPPAPLSLVSTNCPPTGSWEPRADVCVATLGGPEWAISEPSVAMDPTSPDTFAIGVIASAPERSAPQDEEGPLPTIPILSNVTPAPAQTCRSFGICVFWTDDGGATWTSTNPPTKPNGSRNADPTMAFDEAGRLHFASLFHEGARGGISYTSTTDGQNWTPFVEIVFDEGQDRPWIAVDGSNVVVAWQDRDFDLHARVSLDSGQTFHEEIDPWPKCNVNSIPASIDDRFMVVCSDRTGTGDVILLALERSHWREIDRLPDSAGPVLLAASDQWGPVAAYRGVQGLPLLVYQATAWSTLELAQLTDLVQGWQWFWIGALAIDEDDTAHIILLGGEGERCYNAKCPEGSHRHAVHLAISLATGGRVGHAMLTPDPDGGPGRPQGTKQYQDDYDGLDFVGDRGVAAWGREGLVDWTLLVPG